MWLKHGKVKPASKQISPTTSGRFIRLAPRYGKGGKAHRPAPRGLDAAFATGHWHRLLIKTGTRHQNEALVHWLRCPPRLAMPRRWSSICRYMPHQWPRLSACKGHCRVVDED